MLTHLKHITEQLYLAAVCMGPQMCLTGIKTCEEIWCGWRYLLSSFRILRNFSALVSTVLAFSCSLAASSSFSLSDFFKAVHWQGKIWIIFRKIEQACTRARHKQFCCRFHTPGIRMLKQWKKMWDNMLYLAMIMRWNYRCARNRIQTKGGGVLFPHGAFLSTQCNEG